jgi:hypothetical protein
MKLQPITTNFTGGERSPGLDGRVDLARYNASASKLQNCVVLRQGGATARPSRDFKGEVKDSNQTPRLLEFIYNRSTAYVLEFGHLYMRVWKNGVRIEASPGVPFEIATPYTQVQIATVDYVHGGDTMILTHPDVPVQRLLRFGDASWRIEAAPFDPPAQSEVGHRDAAVNLTISSAAIGAGRTITASAAFFLPADVGRVVSWGSGAALITAYTSATSVTATVTSTMPGTAIAGPNWLLEGSPQATITPSAKDPLGANITLTLSIAGWRATDVGRYVDLNGGVVLITSFTSTTVVNAVIKQVLVDVVAVPADAWVLRGSAWNAVDGYPTTCTFYQQRLWLAGTRKYPLTIWGSRTALYYDFTPGTQDDSAVAKTIDSDESTPISYLASAWALLILTANAEFDARGGIEKPITQANCQINKRSAFGCDLVRPTDAGKDIVVVERGGTAVRVITKADYEGFDTRDISVWSDHLFAHGVRSMAWEKRPQQVVWIAAGDGSLVALTYSSEQDVVSFCSGNATGFVEWLVSVPDGPVDATYALVRYTINGATRRYIERLNWSVYPGQDSRVLQTLGVAQTAWGGFAHLEGQTVSMLADGIYVGTSLVVGGVVTVPRPAETLAAGLPYVARIELQAPEVGTGTGTSQGQSMSTHEVSVRLRDTIGSKMNGQYIDPRAFEPIPLDQPPVPTSGLRKASDFGWAEGESPVILEQDQPYPFTVLAVVRDMTVNQG